MALPLILASAFLKSTQDDADAEAARRRAGEQHMQAIRQRQAEVFHHGGSPYSMMDAQYKNSLGDIDRAASTSSNNHIGEMLAAYFGQSKKPGDIAKKGMIGGGTTDSLVDPWADGSSGVTDAWDKPFSGTTSAMDASEFQPDTLDNIDSIFGSGATDEDLLDDL